MRDYIPTHGRVFELLEYDRCSPLDDPDADLASTFVYQNRFTGEEVRVQRFGQWPTPPPFPAGKSNRKANGGHQ